VNNSSDFWDALAPQHWRIENNYLDPASIRRVLQEIRSTVLVVGAGQGLIVAELLKNGLKCDGVDLSAKMIEYAKRRRGLKLIQADAKSMPFRNATYHTLVYATGVVDFLIDEEEIRVILNEATRIVCPSGNVFVAFFRLSAASEGMVARLGLLRNNMLSQREILEIYRLRPAQAIAWVANKAKVGYMHAMILSLRSWLSSTLQEKKAALNMQRIFANKDLADSLIRTAPEKVSYRNEAEIHNLFKRLAIPIKRLGAYRSCYIARI
jgi:ubiquinone/menaquinone biosynthesis C-methylase UbiE